MTDEFAINILEQYRENPTLINEIETAEEAVWLDEALDMAIKALKQQPIQRILAEAPTVEAVPREKIETAVKMIKARFMSSEETVMQNETRRAVCKEFLEILEEVIT
jgi:hypothetical protein